MKISKTLPVVLRNHGLFVVFLFVFLLGGCASVREQVKASARNMSGVLDEIMWLLPVTSNTSEISCLERLERSIGEACGALLEAISTRFRGKEVPLEMQLRVVWSVDHCKRQLRTAHGLINGESVNLKRCTVKDVADVPLESSPENR